jgi:dynein heavy chain
MQGKQCNPTQPQNKDIKNYRAFTALNERVKNMNTILPLIASLHSPYMLERHWKRLEKICGKSINFKSDKFCLADLIQLELFKYAEEVTELVDGAQKEDKIFKKLEGIKAIWED